MTSSGRTFAASILIGVAGLAPQSFAQGDASATVNRNRDPGMVSGVTSRFVAPGPVPALENARPPAGMLPAPPPGPSRSFSGSGSYATPSSDDLRSALRPE